MDIKLFEVRDVNTLIPVLATRFHGDESWLLRRAGYKGSYVILMKLTDCQATHSPGRWGRTLCEAHQYIEINWDSLVDGQVIDVEYIMGESTTPKESENVRVH